MQRRVTTETGRARAAHRGPCGPGRFGVEGGQEAAVGAEGEHF